MQTEGAKMMLEEVPVTFVQKKYNYEAVFSPDGTEVAYRTFASYIPDDGQDEVLDLEIVGVNAFYVAGAISFYVGSETNLFVAYSNVLFGQIWGGVSSRARPRATTSSSP